MNKLLIILLGLLALALLGFFCVYKSHAPAIQQDIQSRTGTALAAEGLDWANASVDGRNITLTGTAPDEASRDRATEVAKVYGYNIIDNQIQLASPEATPVVVTDPYSMTAIKDAGGKISLTGFVPDDETRVQLTSIAVNSFGEDNVSDEMEIVSGAPAYWVDSVKAGLSELALLDEGQAVWNNASLNVTGQVATADIDTQLRENLNDKLPDNVVASFDILVPEPVVTAEPVESQMTDEEKIAAVSCQDQFADLLSRNIIVFRTNSAEIAADSHGLLDRLADVAKGCPSASIQIEGHTDSRGSASYNLDLSQKRAQSVVDYLITSGLDSARLTAAGFGEETPIADNNTEEGRSVNRRIEFNIKGL